MRLSSHRRFLLVVGPSCAGKSTFGLYAMETRGAYHVEASEVLRRLLRIRGLSTASTSSASVVALAKSSAVAKAVVEDLRHRDDPLVVVSGLRTLEELDYFTACAPHSELVYVQAPIRIRFRRCQLRSRADTVHDLDQLRALDREPWCSLLVVAAELACFRIVNAGSLEDYRRAVRAVLDGGDNPVSGLVRLRPRPCERKPYRQLRQAVSNPYLTERDTRILTRYPQLATISCVDGRWRVEVSSAGLAYLSLVDRMFGDAPGSSVPAKPARTKPGAVSSSRA
jgi:dephospho-CoA kinase